MKGNLIITPKTLFLNRFTPCRIYWWEQQVSVTINQHVIFLSSGRPMSCGPRIAAPAGNSPSACPCPGAWAPLWCRGSAAWWSWPATWTCCLGWSEAPGRETLRDVLENLRQDVYILPHTWLEEFHPDEKHLAGSVWGIFKRRAQSKRYFPPWGIWGSLLLNIIDIVLVWKT